MVDIEAKTFIGQNTSITKSDLAAFKNAVQGQVLVQGDRGYDEARAIWNGMIDNRPSVISRCRGVADVITSVKFARSRDLLVSVRGGGHNVSGRAVCNSGLMIDLSQMTEIHVNPQERTVRAEAGALLSDLDRETQAYGLAVPAGTVSETGIAGLTLGGGIGWLSRKYGLTCDNLIGADVVTANGEFITANETENPDLLWGLRGGGGNFGIVTSFKYRAHPVGPTVLAGFVLHPIEHAKEFLEFFSSFIDGVPEELGTITTLRILPPVSTIPQELQGMQVAGTTVCWSGDIEEGEALLRPLRDFGSPVVDSIGTTQFVDHQAIFDAGAPAGHLYYEKSEFLPDLNDELNDVLATHGEAVMSPYSFVGLFQLGGAVARVKEADTAFTHRDAAYSLVVSAAWEDPSDSERHIGWARGFWNAVQPHSTGGVYVNFLSDDDGEDRVRAAYGAVKYDRLVRLKDKYDPLNFFRLNQNIKPTSARDAYSA